MSSWFAQVEFQNKFYHGDGCASDHKSWQCCVLALSLCEGHCACYPCVWSAALTSDYIVQVQIRAVCVQHRGQGGAVVASRDCEPAWSGAEGFVDWLQARYIKRSFKSAKSVRARTCQVTEQLGHNFHGLKSMFGAVAKGTRVQLSLGATSCMEARDALEVASADGAE